MTSLELTFRGVRGSIPTPEASHLGFGGNTSCLEIQSRMSSTGLVIDAGTGVRALGASFAGIRDVHVLLTHFHWDHIQGLPFFAPLYDRNTRVTFHSDKPPEVARELLDCLMR